MDLYHTKCCLDLIIATISKQPRANRLLLHGSFPSAEASRTPGTGCRSTHERFESIDWVSRK